MVLIRWKLTEKKNKIKYEICIFLPCGFFVNTQVELIFDRERERETTNLIIKKTPNSTGNGNTPQCVFNLISDIQHNF